MRVLFVGNSYTFFNDMPEQVAALAASDLGAPALETERVVQGGATLKLHYHVTGAKQRIEEGGFSHVVLQDNSAGPLLDPDEFRVYVALLAELAKARGAEVLLFETWARAAGHGAYDADWSGRSPAEFLRRVAAEYAGAAAKLGARVVPVGTAWAEALSRHPALDLFDEDLHHASPLGSHLTAAVFYAWLTGRDPTPCPFRAPKVDPDEGLMVRAVAHDVVREVVREVVPATAG